MSTPILEVQNICKSFNGVKVLDNVNFVLEKGEIHGLVGQNGAGKSTLMKIITGIYIPDSGDILIEGKTQSYRSAIEAQKAGISMVFQDFSLVSTLTVAQNVFLAREKAGRWGILLNDRFMEEEARRLLSSIGIGSEIDPRERIEKLSVGSQQLVEIAKALSADPKILILDEPTASLSQAEINALFDVINILKNRGISVIYITHYLKDVFRLCDTVTVLRDGKNVLSKSIKDTSMDEVVVAMIGERKSQNSHWVRKTANLQEQPLLSVQNLSTDSVTDINFDLWPGEVVGLAGLLGSGRTELFRALFGVDPIQSGEVFIYGKKIFIKSVSDALRYGIGLVPEDRRNQGLIVDFSIIDNILLPILDKLTTHFKLINDIKGREIVIDYIDKFKVKCSNIFQKVRYLSGGNQQKVVIAKNMVNQPTILLLDDPTFGVDVQSKREIMSIIHQFADAGNGVIFASSEFSEISSFCDRVIVVKQGRIAEIIDNSGPTKLDEEKLLKIVQ